MLTINQKMDDRKSQAAAAQNDTRTTFAFAKALIFLTLGVTLCGFAIVALDHQTSLMFFSGLISLWLGSRSLMSGYLGELYPEATHQD